MQQQFTAFRASRDLELAANATRIETLENKIETLENKIKALEAIIAENFFKADIIAEKADVE